MKTLYEEYYISEIEAESMEAYENEEWEVTEQIAETKEVSIEENEEEQG